jgi:alginate O-acetyltransferase complex protein AlgJ
MLGLGVAAAWGADNASVPVTADGSRERAAALVAQAGDKGVIEGRDGWLFLTAELRFLAAGEFWGAAAGKVSSAAKPEWADPLPAILDFHAQVKKAGATLIFAPVPPKAVVYPDRLPGSEGPAPKTRSDAATARFLDVLRTNGVQVLDLAPAFLEYRARHGDANERRLYCQTDSHWSPLACGLTAELLRQRLADLAALPPPDGHTYTATPATLAIEGDLTLMRGGGVGARETLPAETIADETGAPPADRRDSPILLVGDSHLLVFHAGGDMHATGAGLADRLAQRLGAAVDVVGVRGSGASPSRIALLRRGDRLAGKKVVVWLMTAREFTETQGWRLVPVVK